MGFGGGRATVHRWTAKRKERPNSTQKDAPRRSPSRRECAWLLSRDAAALDERAGRFLRHLYEHAPRLEITAELARRFAALIRGDDDGDDLEEWIADADGSEMASFAAGIERDVKAVKAALTEPWSTSPVEGQINRLKMIKRQMYGRSGYNFLKSKALARGLREIGCFSTHDDSTTLHQNCGRAPNCRAISDILCWYCRVRNIGSYSQISCSSLV